MAVEVIGWVFAHSRSRNAERLVMLAVADACNCPDGTGAWLSNAALRSKTNLSERAVQEAVKGCERLGELKVDRGCGRGGVNRFVVVMDPVDGQRNPADSAPLPTGNPAGSAPFATGNPAGSAPLPKETPQNLHPYGPETPQNLHPAESAPFPGFPQVSAPNPAESAPQAETEKGAESAPGTVSTKNSPTESPSSRRRSSSEPRPDVERICAYLADKIEANGSKRPTIGERWLTAARLMIDADKREVDKILKAIDWCQADEFWRSNILSMPKLREKYDQLRLAAQRQNSRASPASMNRPYRNPENQDDYDDWKVKT